jgi:DNA repair protein RecN (Recombination protein N)
MLNFLQIRNFAIVESLDLEFSGGFTCITGETGAGKSILVDALGLLCGNRADTSTVRAGSDRAELSAEFELQEKSPALHWLREADLDDGQLCLLRRTISETGRSRAWINGTAVTLQQLQGLGAQLVEIHGQNEHMQLIRSREQFRLLDESGQYAKEIERVRLGHGRWRELETEKQALLSETPLDAGDLDLMRYQIRELESAMLPAAEFTAIETEHRLLAHGSEILDSLNDAISSLEDEHSGAGLQLHKAARQLDIHAELDKDISMAAGLLRESAINCDEALNAIQEARSRLQLSPGRLQELESQLSTQHELARKHRTTPEQLQEVLNRLRERLERSGSVEARLDELEARLESELSRFRAAAKDLNKHRMARAAELAKSVTDLMQELGMKGGQFEFHVRHDDTLAPSPLGSDRLDIQVSANPGVPPGPLQKVASGGELSRISLAIKVASNSDSSAAQVFDEVDAGIGGDTANSVGALLKSLSAGGQALCVTHLAQVAVFADQQLQVLKSSQDRETRVETSLLADDARIDEIARMLGGRLSDQSRAHALDLLNSALTRH